MENVEVFDQARHLLGFGLIVFDLIWELPFVLHVIRKKSTVGLSFSGKILVFSFALTWLIYGITQGSAVLIVSGAFSVLTSLSLLIAMVVYGPRVKLSQFWPLLIFASMVIILFTVSFNLFVIVFSIAVSLKFFPQIAESVRNIVGGVHGAGISPHGATMAIVGYSGWLLWGVWAALFPSTMSIDWPNSVSCGFGVISFSLMLINAKMKTRNMVETPDHQLVGA